MPTPPLPDLPTRVTGSRVEPAAAAVEWTRGELEALLASSDLAGWARDWMLSLGRRLGDGFPRLVQKGLGKSSTLPRWLASGSPDPLWLRSYLERSELAAAWFDNGFLADDPAWLQRLLLAEQAQVARSFLLSGNITDYAFDPVQGYRPAIRLLVDRLMATKDCVLTYRLSQGLVLHAREPSLMERLPQEIRRLLEDPEFRSEPPLLAQICHLFDVLRRWLTGSLAAGGGELLRGVAIVFENVHLSIPQSRNDVERNFLVDNLLLWSVSPELFRSNHCLILMAEALEDVANDLRARGGKIEQVHLPRPGSEQARLKFLLPLLDPSSRMPETRVARLPQGQDWLRGYCDGPYLDRLRRLSRDTAGLSLLGIEDLLQQAAMSPEGRLAAGDVLALKRERLRQESDGLLEVVEPRRTLDDVGGYQPLKDRLREVVAALDASGDPLRRSTVPMGILFLGPPGTGKSIAAEALAGESRYALAKLGNFRGMYVGESERNLGRILALIEALHPVLVFIDEIDQALGQRSGASGDSGVENRIFGRLLEFMSDEDHRGRILWIGATNFPARIDPAMKRAGRFDLALPFLLPDEASRAEILKVLLRRKLRGVASVVDRVGPKDLAGLAAATHGCSGAELEAIVGEVLRRLAREQEQSAEPLPLSADQFHQVLAVYRPPAGARGRYLEMEREAIAEVSFLDLLPEPHRQQRQRLVAGESPAAEEAPP